MRVGATRGAGTPVTVDAVPGEDVVVLEIAGGPSLVLHPETARELMLAQGDVARPATTRGAAAAATGPVDVPAELRWRGLESAVATRGAARGFLGNVLLKAFHVVTGLVKDPAADLAASAVVRNFDGRVEEGVYRLRPEALSPLKGSDARVDAVPAPPNAGEPILVLVHGTFSSTDGTFSKLWTGHPDLVRRLFDAYGGRVYALDHRTLGVSPIANALTLARALPRGADVHLLTHSRGGLVAEVLARVCSDPDADASEFDGAKYADHRADLRALSTIVREKQLAVGRVVRVACPARGTLLASKRLDAYLSVVRWTMSLAGVPVAPELVSFLGEVARRRADPALIPGLEAQIPDGRLVRWLHAATAPIAGELRVVAGDMEGDSVTSWLKTLMADAYYWTDNDLVVQTRSMYGGAARAATASFVLDQGGSVSHFGYFANDRTARAVVDGLVEAAPRDFRAIGPLSAAGQSSTGVRAARPAARAAAGQASDRPAVFVLPGILGSNLRVGADRVWLGWRVVHGLERLAYGTRGVSDDGPIEQFYGDLAEYLGDSHDVVQFGFDWRRPIEDEARRLAAEVGRALDARATSGQPVRLVAHSMGGLLARAMWLEEPEVWERMMAHDGARLLMLGTPNEGSWAPMQVLSGDDTFGNVLSLVGAPFREHDARALMAGFPGFLQLQASLLDPALGLHDAATWERLAATDLERLERRSWWHALPIQRDAYRWGVPSQAVLDRAVALRRRLDQQREAELPAVAAKLSLVVGRAPATPDGFELDADGVVYLDAENAGDGRVTLESALLPGVRTWRVDCDHGSLPRDREAFAGYADLLARGTTERLELLAGAGTRGAAAAAVSHVRSRPSRGRVSTRPPESEGDVLRQDPRRASEGPTTRGNALRVTVHNGDLTFVREPLLIGHYRSMKLTGTERVMDGLLKHQMQRALDAGLYPSETGTSKVFVNRHPAPDSPSRFPRPAAVIIAGLGPEGELRGSELVTTVRQAVLSWAERAAELPDAPESFELTATLIGSGGAGISAGQSAQLVAQGVREANDRLATSDWPPVEHLRLIELYLDRATEAWSALQLQAAASPGLYVVDDEVAPGVGALRRPLDADYRGADYDFMSVQSADGTATETRISYRLATRRARTEVRGQALQGKLVRELVARASNDRNADPQIRRTLFQLLVPPELEPFLGGTTDLVLEVDGGTAGIPWEILDTGAGAGADGRPWAIRSKMLRKLRTGQFRADPADADAEASVLVIGEPACDAGTYPRLPGARREAAAVAATLSAALQAAGGRVRPLISPDDPARQGADARTVLDALLERPWRVIHLSGHGEPPDEQGDPRGVVLSSGTFLGPREINSMRVVPELVFVNCCHLAARESSDLLSGCSPPDRARFAANVAEALIAIGVRCVIAAGWAVDDEAASTFATTFYGALARGLRFIDAVDEARRAAFDAGGNTWAAYQCYGDPDWRLRREVGDGQRPTEPIRQEFGGIASPQGLTLALERVAVQSRYWGLDRHEQRPKLEYLDSRFGGRWGAKGYVCESFGAAWQAVGDPARAAAWFERATGANDGTATLRAVELLANLRVRMAWAAVEALADPDGGPADGRWPKRRGRVSAAPAARRAGHDAVVRDARARIEEAITMFERLAAVRPSMERESLHGSAYKRLAMLEAAAGGKRAEREAVAGMKRCYARAEALGRRAGLPGVFYPAMNRMAAELVVDGARAGWKGFDAADVTGVRALLDAQVDADPDFWSVAGQSELRMYEAVADGSLGRQLPAILEAYRDLHERVRAAWMWASVHDQASLVLGAYVRRATAGERKAAEALLKVLAKLGAR